MCREWRWERGRRQSPPRTLPQIPLLCQYASPTPPSHPLPLPHPPPLSPGILLDPTSLSLSYPVIPVADHTVPESGQRRRAQEMHAPIFSPFFLLRKTSAQNPPVEQFSFTAQARNRLVLNPIRPSLALIFLTKALISLGFQPNGNRKHNGDKVDGDDGDDGRGRSKQPRLTRRRSAATGGKSG